MKRFTAVLLTLTFAVSGLSLGCNKGDENKPNTGKPNTPATRPTTAPSK